MSVTINYSNNVQVNGKLTHSASRTIRTEAYDEINVTIPPAAGDGSPGTLDGVDVQPGAANRVLFLFITSNVLDPTLTYSVEGGASDIALDSDQTFSGTGMLSFLGASPMRLSFSNGTTQEARVRIQVGRQAAPEPA